MSSNLAMPYDPLWSAWIKINRAKRHLGDLEREISAFHAREPYNVLIDVDTEPGQTLFRANFRETIPIAWGGIIGDIIHNLRAALDNAATGLTIHNGCTSKSWLSATYFPMGSSKENFEAALKKKMRGASVRARRVVERLKPYQGGADAFWRLHNLGRSRQALLLSLSVPATLNCLSQFPFHPP